MLYLCHDLTLHYPLPLTNKIHHIFIQTQTQHYRCTKKCVVAWKVFKKTSKYLFYIAKQSCQNICFIAKQITTKLSSFQGVLTLHCPVNIKLKKGQQHHFVLGSNVFTFQSFVTISIRLLRP